MRVLVTGAGGLVGGRLASLLARDVEVVAGVHLSPAPAGLPTVAFDLLAPDGFGPALDAAQAEAVVHCAALADADACERDPARAEACNAHAPAVLARECAGRGVRLVGLSTDLVFAGDRAWVGEAAEARPLSVYGRTKLAGERAVLDACPGSAVARVALVCGRGRGTRPTASEAVAWQLRAGGSPRLFTDQHRTPVDPGSLADALLRLLRGGQEGLFHLGGPERVSRFELGQRLARVLGLDSVRLLAGRQADLALSAARPPDVSLDSSRARRELGWQPRPLDEAIREGRTEPAEEASGRGA